MFRKTGKLVSLSEQNLVDCSKENSGCNGGLMDLAFAYIKKNGGIDTEASYPYVADEGDHVCKFNASTIGGRVTGFVDIQTGNETQLTEAIATIGPISVAIDADSALQHYKGGIFDEFSCNPETLNHGVLAVGYGSEGGKDFYIVKNSWSDSWGEKGYIRMSRNKKDQCGIAEKASYPLV
jgi:cathepsin L